MFKKPLCQTVGTQRSSLIWVYTVCVYISNIRQLFAADKDCRTVSEAVDFIERYEAIMGDYTDRKKPTMRTIDASPLVQSVYTGVYLRAN